MRTIPLVVFVLLPVYAARSAPVVEVQMRIVTTPSNDETLVLPPSLVSVCVGTPIFLEVWVLSVEPGSSGVAGGTVDVIFPVEVDSLIIDHGTVYIELPTGTIDVASRTIFDLGGNTLRFDAAASPTWALLGRVSFSMVTLGDAVFSLEPGSLRFALSGGEPPLDFTTDVLIGPVQIVSIGQPGSFGDFDCDLDVDLNDFIVLYGCLSEPDAVLSACDADSDGDTDLKDFALFQFTFSGEGG